MLWVVEAKVKRRWQIVWDLMGSPVSSDSKIEAKKMQRIVEDDNPSSVYRVVKYARKSK
jgi:hypothetical protein